MLGTTGTISTSLRFSRLSRWAVCLALAAVAGVAGDRSSRAGASASRPASCTFNKDGTGFCSGSLKAFRNSSDSTAQMILDNLQTTTGATRRINLTFNGTNKVLSVPPSPAGLTQTFDMASSNVTAHIYVRWTAANVVEALQLYNQSGLL